MRALLFLLAFFSALASAQAPAPPKINIEQGEHTINLRAEGSLASTHTVGCIPLSDAKNSFTPPDLYKGMADCVDQDKYDLAAGMFILAGMYGTFDTQRVTDKTAWQAKTVLIMNTFAKMPQDKKEKMNDVIKRLANNPQSLGQLCSEVQQVGMPDYYPSYMILHGMKVFTGNPHDGALLKDFDGNNAWAKLQGTYLHCPA